MLPVILKDIAAIATLPTPAAERFAADYKLEISEPPVKMPKYNISLAWLAKVDRDPAHLWLRKSVKSALDGGH